MSELLLVVLLAAPAAIGQTYFVYRYARYSTWRSHRIGRALMVKSSALALLVNAALFNELAYFLFSSRIVSISSVLELIAYVLVTIAIYWQLIQLLKSQRQKRKTIKHDEN